VWGLPYNCCYFYNFELIEGEVELDESYFRARRIKGKRGRGAAGKTVVFGVLKRDDKVYFKKQEMVDSTYVIGNIWI
jgi:transposase-like protein